MDRLPRFLFGTIRGRLILSVALVHAVMMSLFIVDLTGRQDELLLQRQVEEATSLSKALATSAADWIVADDVAGLQELVDAQAINPDVAFVLLTDRDGRVLAASDRARLGQFVLDMPRDGAFAILSQTQELVDAAAPAVIDASLVGWVRVGEGQSGLGARRSDLVRNGVLYALGAILIGSLIAWFMGRRVTRRLYAVQETIDAVRSGDRDARSRLTGADEAAAMAREFNSMLDALDTRDTAIRASEARYRSLIEEVQTAIVVHDGQGRVLESNPMARQLLGITEDELHGRTLVDPQWQFVNEDGRAMAVEDYPASRVIATGQPLRNYLRGIRHPGSDDITWTLVNAEPELDDSGALERIVVSFVDITERRLAEQAIRDQHSTLRGIIDGVPALVFSVDARYRYTSFNRPHADMMRAIYGVEIEAGRSILDCMTVEADRVAARAHLGRALAGEQLVEEAYSGDLEHGRRFFRVSHSPIRSDGEVIGVAVLAQDLTERQIADESLRHLNRELRAISSCNQVLVRAEDEQTLLDEICAIIVDEAGYALAWVGFVDREAGRVHPAAVTEAAPSLLESFAISWDDTDHGAGPIGAAIRTGQVACVQDVETDPLAVTWREAARGLGYRSAIALPLKDESGTVFGVLTIASTETGTFTPDEVRLLEELSSDLAFGITVLRTRANRRVAEEALRTREEQYRRFVQDDVAGVFVTSVDGRVQTCNPEFARMFGFASVEEALATNVVTIYPDRAAREALLDELRANGRIDRREMAWRRVDGTPVYAVETAIGDVDETGELVAIRGYVVDITERKRLEEQFRQSQKMEAIGRLAGGVAHDFNNLLTAINGYADILASGMTPDDRRRADVEEIRKAGDRAAALTRQLLAFSRRQVLQPVVLDLNDVVAGITPMLRRLIGEQIELRTLVAPDLGNVRADPAQLEQVLLNLAVNARDAMPGGGTLTIETANIDIDETYLGAHPLAAPGPHVLLTVTDTGTGMDADTMAHLFEPFFTTKPAGEGTGLGLATVYGIVTGSGGRVDAYSEPGMGSVFRVYLPRVSAAVEAPVAAAHRPVPGGTERILVVEDDGAVRALVERILGGLGYAVTGARSGAEALSLVGRGLEKVDLLVTDIMLPGINGRQLSERLVARQPSLRTLYISGYTEDAVIHQGVLDPGVAFLGKPFTPDALGRAVRDALDTLPVA